MQHFKFVNWWFGGFVLLMSQQVIAGSNNQLWNFKYYWIFWFLGFLNQSDCFSQNNKLIFFQAALTRERRSVNFTPSWGKRSAGMDLLRSPQIMQNSASDEGSRCLSKGLYLEMLVETLKVSWLYDYSIILGSDNSDIFSILIHYHESQSKHMFKWLLKFILDLNR